MRLTDHITSKQRNQYKRITKYVAIGLLSAYVAMNGCTNDYEHSFLDKAPHEAFYEARQDGTRTPEVEL